MEPSFAVPSVDKTAPNLVPPWMRIAIILHWVLLICIYSFFIAKALLVFSISYDFLWYHLPLSLRRYHLTSFIPEPRLLEREIYFPPSPTSSRED